MPGRCVVQLQLCSGIGIRRDKVQVCLFDSLVDFYSGSPVVALCVCCEMRLLVLRTRLLTG